jgi:hypothetical protein
MGFFIDEETTVPTGFYIEEDAPEVSLGQAAKYVGKNLLQGAGDLVGMGADLFASPGSMVKPSQTINSYLDPITKSPTLTEDGKYQVGGEIAEVVGAGVRSSVFPEAPIANAVVGGSAKLGEILNPENPLIGGILGTILGVGGTSAAKGVANTLTSAGKAFERSSVGAQGKNYVKSQKIQGLLTDDETGELSTRLGQAIEETADTRGFGFLRDPDSLATKNAAIRKEVGAQVEAGLKAADAANVKPNINFTGPDSAVNKLISQSKAEKSQVKEAFDEFKNKFLDPVDGWDGSVEGLNSWKSSIGNLAFSGSAKGTLTPEVTRKVQRAIAEDLGMAVDDAVIGSGAIKPNDWAKTMREYSNAKQLQPIFEEGTARGMGGTWDKAARGLLRTSGGTLTTPTVIGGLLAGGTAGAGVGLATGAGLALLGTPTGQGITGNMLKALGRTGSRALNSSLATRIAAGVEGLNDNESISKGAEPVKRQQFEAAIKPQAEVPEVKLTPVPSQLNNLDKTARIKKTADFVKSQPPLIQAVILTESSGDPFAQSPTGPIGLMQLTKRISNAYGAKDRLDPKQNVKAGTAFLQDLAEKYQDPFVAIAAYQAGETVINKAIKAAKKTQQTVAWADIENLLPEETQNYPYKVEKNLSKVLKV